MPLNHIVNDGLWHCLCPNVSLQAATRPAFIPVQRLKRHRRATPPKQHHSFAEQTARWPYRSHASHIIKRCLHDGLFRSRTNVGGQPQAPKIERVYAELKSWSRKADYLNVQALVEYLVKTRGERPNNRIYEALILANADALHGSPAEVGKILQEMGDEGLSPDSGTYHAVLKVRDLQSTRLVSLTTLGPCRSSRLPPSDPCSSIPSRALVLPHQRGLSRSGSRPHP